MEKIVEVYAFVSPDPKTGDEQTIILINNETGKEREAVFPWKDVAEMAYPLVLLKCKDTGRSFKVLRFTLTEDVTEQFKNKFVKF